MEKILTIFATMKKSKFGDKTIQTQFNKQPYDLVPLTYDSIYNTHLVKLLARWRKKHEFWFPSQFPVTFEKTKVWLRERVLDEKDRILFMICIQDVYVGHLGFYRFDSKNRTLEIDNVIRGSDILPGIMSHAMITLMRWGVRELSLNDIIVQVGSDNLRAKRFYEKLGFSETKRIPLVLKKEKNISRWVEAPSGYNQPIHRYSIYMLLR